MNANPRSIRWHLSPTLAQVVDPACDRFEAAWKTAGKDGPAPPIQDYLSGVEEPARSVLLGELLVLEVAYRRRRGEQPTRDEYRERFPGQDTVLDSLWAEGGAAAPDADQPPVPDHETIDDPAPHPSPKPEADWPLVPGYEVVKVLGKGGMGVVYLARHLPLDRLVALKTLRDDRYAGPSFLSRFRAEAAALARLQNSNIMQIYEVGEAGDRPYFAMEFCPGGSLEDRLAGKPLPPKEAARLMETLARAMDAAHQQKVIHRDLKPANVLFGADGTMKVSDFGLARLLDRSGWKESGVILGTASYMPPEQALARNREVGAAADVYALGAVLYEMLTGRPPFVAPTPSETLQEVVADEPVPPRRLQSKTPRDLETICLKCLEKQPGRRYATALKLAEDLGRFLRQEPIVVRPPSRLYRLGKFAQRNRGLVAGTALVLLVFVAGVVGTSIGVVRALTAGADAERARADKAAAEIKSKDELLAQSHYAAVRVAMQRGAWRSALDNLDEAVSAGYPDSAALHLDKVRALCALNELPRAEQELQSLSERTDLGDLEGQVRLWQADLALNHSWKDEKALAMVQQALDKGLPPAEEAYARGLLAPTSPGALQCFQEAVQKEPSHQRANAMLGLLLILLGHNSEAHERIAAAEQFFPEDPTFRLLHALLETLEGDSDAANQQLDRATPSLKPAQMKSARALLDLARQAPLLAKYISDDPKATVWNAATQALPPIINAMSALSDPDADLFLPLPPVLFKAFEGLPLDLSLAANLLLNPDAVVPKLDHAVKIHPEGLLFLARGMLLAQRDDEEGWMAAERDFLKASEASSLIPIRPRALYMAAASEWVLYREHGSQPEMRLRSLLNLRKVVARGGLDADQFNAIVVMATTMGDYNLARYTLDEWALQAPDDPKILGLRVHVEAGSGSYRRAIEVIDQILAKKPSPEEGERWKKERANAEAKLQSQAKAISPPPGDDPGP